MTSAPNAQENDLAARLRERIRSEGPINFYDWMQAALYDPQAGYYSRADLMRQGRAGDYRTAPETSQLFAATFAQYFMKSYYDLGAPEQWHIVEVGAGAGRFAHGMLRCLETEFPKIFDATKYILAEMTADNLSKAAAELERFSDRVEFRRLEEIDSPFENAIIFSNELIDAFPVHRVIGRNDSLRELHVGLNNREEFIWVESDLDEDVAAYGERISLHLADGQVFEINLAAEEYVARGAKLLGQGLLITVDYGASREELLTTPHRFKGTLRAFHRHQLIDDVFANPGSQDLTTTIDWTQLQEAGNRYGLETLGLQSLDRFLIGEGLLEGLQNLARTLTQPADIVNLQLGAREMILPNGLAAAFQVLIQRKES